MRINPILDTDSYKASHFKQYPPGTEYVFSYIESRGGEYDKTVMFGLQMFLDRYMLDPITMLDVDEAEEVCKAHGEPFNREGWEYIVSVHRGFLPLEIKAVPEGTVIEGKNVLVTVVNTDPRCPWVTSYAETKILRAVWYGTTVATQSWYIKQDLIKALEATADKPEEAIGFMLNDFGARGVSSYESSEIGGLAHLVNFMGTDNLPAIMAARKYYNCPMAGFSIPAAEHSTITSWGGPEFEVDAFRNMITQFKENKIFAVVSDSYDINNACSNIWGQQLHDEVKGSGARLVVRPDSGDPTTVPVECIKILMQRFGFLYNRKGYKVLPAYIRVIQGDGINRQSIQQICFNLMAEKISIENICFGMGGALLQGINRDTLKFAMKCSAICVNGVWRDVFKDPITDKGKQSKKGRLGLYKDADGKFVTERVSLGVNLLRLVYENGHLHNRENLDEIRARTT